MEKMVKKMVWFDMDGTIADLYGVEGWLEMLMAEDTAPYAQAKPLVRMSQLAKLLHRVQAAGYGIGVISWTSKSGSWSYNEEVAQTKLEWLKQHLPSVVWDEINVVSYGNAKQAYRYTDDDILFDDEAHNRQVWTGEAYEPNEIMVVLKELIHGA